MGRTKLEKIFPTYNGYIANSNDALIVLQAVLNGVLKPVNRRPNESERSELIKSGNVFVFIEETSGIKRWTDGTSWSPSRILARFLIYRELSKNSSSNSATNLKQKDSKNPRDSKNSISKTQLSEIVNSNSNGDKNNNTNNNNNNNEINKLNSRTITAHALAGGDAIVNSITKKRSRSKSNGSISSDISNFSSIPSPKSSITNITTSTTNTSISSSSSSTLDDNIYRSDGLIKKSMSLCLFPNTQFRKTIHLVSYYRANDVLNNLLNNPTNDQLLKNVELSFELLESLRNTSLGNMLSTRGSSESFESHGFCENDGFDEKVLINFSKQYNEKYSIISKRRQLNSLYQYQPQYPPQHHQYPFQNQYQPQYQLPPHQLTHSQSDHEINYHSQFANYNHHHHSYDNSAIPIKYEDNKIPFIPSMSYPLPSYNNKIPNNNLNNFNINFSHNPQSYNNNIPSYIPNYDNNLSNNNSYNSKMNFQTSISLTDSNLNSNMNNNVSNNGSNSEILNNETIFNNNNNSNSNIDNTNVATTSATTDAVVTTTTAASTTDNKNDSIINDGDKNEVTTGSTNLSKIPSIFSQGNNSPIIYGYNNNTNSNSGKINLQSTTPIPKQLSPPNNFHNRVSSSNATQFGYPPTTQYSPVSYQQPLFDYQTIPTQLPLQTNSPNSNNPLIQLVRTPFSNNSRSNTPNTIQNLNPNQNQRIYSLQYVTSTTPISYNNNMINNNMINNNIININKLDTINKSKTPISVKIENDDTPDKNNNNTSNAGSANNLNEENISVKIESESNVVNGNETYRSVYSSV